MRPEKFYIESLSKSVPWNGNLIEVVIVMHNPAFSTAARLLQALERLLAPNVNRYLIQSISIAE